MAAVTTGSFSSSVVTTLDSWREFVEHDPQPLTLITEADLSLLTPAERLVYDDVRSDYHAALPALKIPILDRTVPEGLLFMRLNRGQQLGTSCGMILSGVPGVGKTTAIRALGRTVERSYRTKNPQMTNAVPVVYITMPAGQHPRALPAELLYFLGAGRELRVLHREPGPTARQAVYPAQGLPQQLQHYPPASGLGQTHRWFRARPAPPCPYKPGTLLPLADYLYGRTGGYIVSLSHLIREAAIKAILSGTERIDEEILESVELDHAATQEAATQRQAIRKSRKPSKP